VDNKYPDSESHKNPTHRSNIPTRKHFLVVLAIPLVFLLVGIALLSIAALVGLIFVIVAIAITVGIVMAAVRLKRQSKIDTEPAQWKTRTLPLTSLIIIVGLAICIFVMFSNR
jgi:uncharacterized membrane protein YecN with MAPEG domain